MPAPPGNARTSIDFNADLKDDLLWRNTSTGGVAIWLMNGLATLSSAIVYTDPNYSVTNTGDLNGDGKSDLIWRRTSGATVAWLMNGTSTSSFATLYTDPNWAVQRVADFNGDGKDRHRLVQPRPGSTAIWLMDGRNSERFRTSSHGARHWEVSVQHVGDFNGDGKSRHRLAATPHRSDGHLAHGRARQLAAPSFSAQPRDGVVRTSAISMATAAATSCGATRRRARRQPGS